MEKLKTCPFCNGEAFIQVCDDEGNFRDEEYEADPWSGVSYQIVHDTYENEECPIASHNDGIVGSFLYGSRESLIKKWNTRI